MTIEKIEIIPIGTFKEPKVTSSSATMDSIKLTTNIDRADGFYTVYYGTESGNYTMTSQGHHERIAYLTGLKPDTTYYGKVEMRVNGVLTQTEEFTVKTLAEESGVTDPWSVPGAFTDDFSDVTESKDRWIVLGDSVVTYSGGKMNIGNSLNVKAVTGSENWQNYTVEATLNPGESGRDCGVMIRTTNATASGPDAYNGYYIGVKEGAVIVGYADGGWHQMGSEIPAAIEKNRECNLKVVVVGDQFAIFVDDVQVGGLITPPVKYESGQVGLRSYNNPFTCDNFTVREVTQAEKQVFETSFVGFTDNFSDTDPTPWTVLGDTDAVRFDGEKMNVGFSSNIKVVAGEESWTDYTVEGTFTCGEATQDKNCGLMFRTTGATNEKPDSYQGYYVGLGTFFGDEGIVVGYGNNSWNFLETIPYDYTPNIPYTLKVVVVGNQFAVYVNDEFQKIFTSDLFTEGQVGVRSYKFPFTCDNFSVRAVNETELDDINRATSILETDGTTSFHEGAQIKFATLTGNYTYKIQYGTAPGVYTHEYVGLTSKHNPDKLAISGLEDGTTYYLRVVAMSGGEEVAWSEEVTVAPGETDDPQDEIANLQSLLTQAEAVAEKSNVLEDRIAYAKKVLGMSGANRMDLTTAQAILQSAMNQNELDLSKEEDEDVHIHTLTPVPAVAATCNAMGHTAYYTCSGCKEWFADAEGKEIISDHSSVITDKDPDNHTGGTEIRDAKEPTYTEEGYTGDTYCLGCGKKIAEGQVVPKLSSGTVHPSTPVEPVQPADPVTIFEDISVGDWYYEAVSYVSKQGLMTGVGNGKFNPDGAVTRAMVWTVLARMAGENTEGGATWYSRAQEWAMRTGVSDGTNPMGSITREQLAAMLYRYAGSPVVSGNLSAYPDANKVSDWAVDAMVWATEEGIINGMNGYLKPQDGATRAQLAAMLMRFVEEQ